MIGVALEVFRQSDRSRRRIEVLAVDHFRVERLEQLHVAALPAHAQIQVKGVLCLVEPLLGYEIVADGRLHQAQSKVVAASSAKAAGIAVVHFYGHVRFLF